MSEVVYSKPTMWCLFLHQVYWNFHEDNDDISYCSICKKQFFYPTKKHHRPVYEK